MEEHGFVAEGFRFAEKYTAEQAEREAEGIVYIRERTDMEDPATLLQLYQKLTAEPVFETPVGIGFLKELRDKLEHVPGLESEQLEPVDATVLQKKLEDDSTYLSKIRDEKRERQETEHKYKKLLQKVRKNLRISLLVNLALALIVTGMFVIALTGKSPTILNFENKIVDKYAKWEEELTQREEQLRQKERNLGITP